MDFLVAFGFEKHAWERITRVSSGYIPVGASAHTGIKCPKTCTVAGHDGSAKKDRSGQVF